MGPLIPQEIISPQWSNVIALLLGIAFGFILESSGFSSSRKLAGVFYGYDFVVLRVFFTAAITAMLGLLYFNHLGWIDMSFVYINPTFLTSSIVGGLVMGLGFIMGGYCPGTSVCGAGIGKIDAMVFTGGLFIGIFLFSEAFPFFENFYYKGDMGNPLVYDVLGISAELFVFLLILVALAAFYFTSKIEKRINKVEK